MGHLHDSIQFHPNKYNIIKESIENVYLSSKLNNILYDKFILRMRNSLLEQDLKEFDSLVSDLYIDFIPFKISKNNLNIDGMFPFE